MLESQTLYILLFFMVVISILVILILYCVFKCPKKGNKVEPVFSAVGDSTGVILQWQYNISELPDWTADQLLFPIQVWKPTTGFDPEEPGEPNITKMIGKIITPVGEPTIDYAFDINFPNQTGLTGDTWQYQTTIDNTEFPEAGQYYIALAAQLSGETNLQSEYSSPATDFDIIATISDAAVFVGFPFSAVRSTAAGNDVVSTKVMLLFSQIVDKYGSLDSACWVISNSNSTEDGFTKNQSNNGVNLNVSANEIGITVDKNFEITGTMDSCCCLPPDAEMGVYTGTVSENTTTYYIFLVADSLSSVPDASVDKTTIAIELDTYNSVDGECSASDEIGETSKATIYIFNDTQEDKSVTVSCAGGDKEGCPYTKDIKGGTTSQTKMTKCIDYPNTDVPPFTDGGSAVTLSLQPKAPVQIEASSFFVEWNVTESAIHLNPVSFTIYTDAKEDVIWNLPPGSYSVLAVMYIQPIGGGNFVPAQVFETKDQFTINLPYPENISAEGENVD